MKRLITLILAIALCVPLYIPVQAEYRYDLSEYSLLLNIKDVYPIQPGTEEWKKLETLQSKIAACEIPKETLHQMSTESLIEAVLYYPLFSNMYAYDSIEEGFDAVLQYCDALQELQRRDDAADALAARYKNTYSNQNADVSNQNADVLASSAELMHMTYMQMQKHTEKRKNQTLLLIEPFFNQLDEADKLYLCESIAVLPTNQTNATMVLLRLSRLQMERSLKRAGMMTTILRHLVAFLMMRYITLIWKWRGFILMQYGERVRPNAIIAILMHGMTNRLKTMFGLLILFRT